MNRTRRWLTAAFALLCIGGTSVGSFAQCVNDSYTFCANDASCQTLNVTANDQTAQFFPTHELIISFTQPAHGKVDAEEWGWSWAYPTPLACCWQLVYTLEPAFSGTVSFTYTAVDAIYRSQVSTATVTLRILPPISYGRPPRPAL